MTSNESNIDMNKIPQYLSNEIADAVISMIDNILKMPNGRAMLDAEKRRLGLCK